MKSLFLAALLLLGTSLRNGHTQIEVGPVGRFYLVQGEYNVPLTNGNKLAYKAMFRIDTVTGKTDQYLPTQNPKGSGFDTSWVTIKEF